MNVDKREKLLLVTIPFKVSEVKANTDLSCVGGTSVELEVPCLGLH